MRELLTQPKVKQHCSSHFLAIVLRSSIFPSRRVSGDTPSKSKSPGRRKWLKICANNVVLLSAGLIIFALLFLMNVNKSYSEVTRPNFARKKINVAGHELLVEIADNEEKREFGLMFIEKPLPENQGMLFIFPNERPLGFWMKNTLIPLSIGFFDKNCKLINYLDMKPVQSTAHAPLGSYESQAPAKFAIEVNRGWFASRGIKPGSTFSCK